MKIRNTAEIVKEILEQKPRARDCDFVLYGFVLNKYGYSVSIPFNELANLVKAEELPSMEKLLTNTGQGYIIRVEIKERAMPEGV